MILLEDQILEIVETYSQCPDLMHNNLENFLKELKKIYGQDLIWNKKEKIFNL